MAESHKDIIIMSFSHQPILSTRVDDDQNIHDGLFADKKYDF